MGQGGAKGLQTWVCGASAKNEKSGEQPVSVLRGPGAGMSQSASTRERASRRAQLRLRCAERITSTPTDRNSPVKLVVFDFDETLTLATFMTGNPLHGREEKELAKTINFESPWVQGSRLAKLKQMFTAIEDGKNGQRRTLSVLTNNGKGVKAVLNMLNVADLDSHFSAVWVMPWRKDAPNGAYKRPDGSWMMFDPPLQKVRFHKADVIHHVTKFPEEWFPQLKESEEARKAHPELLHLSVPSVVLVDDQRVNFLSPSGASVHRYCKVARYDTDSYHDMGALRNLGGIGAHDDADYDTLLRFLEDPWMCKETLQVRCQEREYDGWKEHRPVKLVVFDFDETLTLATFMPDSEDCAKHIGWTPAKADSRDWSESDLLTYNFETPWCDGSRLSKLSELLQDVSKGGDGQCRQLAVCTQNEGGVVAVLNLLQIAGLAKHFTAIWSLAAVQPSGRDGAFQVDGQWQLFGTPRGHLTHKADVLQDVAKQPERWLPQFAQGGTQAQEYLRALRPESIVLVDDERANFRSEGGGKVLRYCKVARYDEQYRDCGLLNQMGGIGAHSDDDYRELKTFLGKPWEYPYPGRAEDHKEPVQVRTLNKQASVILTRLESDDSLEPLKRPRSRMQSMANLAELSDETRV
eukprot:TRINITY_DN11067_c0_g1_i2.p1 TRINITY_DN11067_c0_g1~~TRINITY_DN11067_c0_g1_i2.p1  ORF type:complete len:647 (-),score=121.11 TRINITY_DN11067_c0_g1_i2:256-2160(-)